MVRFVKFMVNVCSLEKKLASFVDLVFLQFYINNSILICDLNKLCVYKLQTHLL